MEWWNYENMWIAKDYIKKLIVECIGVNYIFGCSNIVKVHTVFFYGLA